MYVISAARTYGIIKTFSCPLYILDFEGIWNRQGSEAVAQTCSVKKVFLEISQNS